MNNKLTFTNKLGTYYFEFLVINNNNNTNTIYAVDIYAPNNYAWIHGISNGKIIKRYDDWFPLTDDVKEYIEKCCKLQAFI